ncbi:hypothetical protein DICSQDRAFT_134553 [Dichomitus squalens LYAD-421 SS1]|uniref:uncharacterized protein n=1 Tax=Dichomitus squalens (strain LYAD-421) TaxID=732165 RepID=UPI0004413746|nr:uncharacterized protein DICSQDRAFT_134553 [Dichomitus squalens LYAD-421 SS1]EJF63980.1 hypothetical protein DICSQDRAFT_134553 [Dichomitus squalens LYAD-421 SS1]
MHGHPHIVTLVTKYREAAPSAGPLMSLRCTSGNQAEHSKGWWPRSAIRIPALLYDMNGTNTEHLRCTHIRCLCSAPFGPRSERMH